MAYKKLKMCRCCGTERSVKDFYYYKNSAGEEIEIPVCKQCANERFKKHNSKMGSFKAALWLVMAYLDIPFISNAYIYTKEICEGDPSADPCWTYINALQKFTDDIDGFWQSDTMLNEIVQTNKDGEFSDVLSLEDERERLRD